MQRAEPIGTARRAVLRGSESARLSPVALLGSRTPATRCPATWNSFNSSKRAGGCRPPGGMGKAHTPEASLWPERWGAARRVVAIAPGGRDPPALLPSRPSKLKLLWVVPTHSEAQYSCVSEAICRSTELVNARAILRRFSPRRTELHPLPYFSTLHFHPALLEVVAGGRIELPTRGFSVLCSTN